MWSRGAAATSAGRVLLAPGVTADAASAQFWAELQAHIQAHRHTVDLDFPLPCIENGSPNGVAEWQIVIAVDGVPVEVPVVRDPATDRYHAQMGVHGLIHVT